MTAELIPFQPEPEKGPGSDERLVDLTYEEQQILEYCREGKGRNEIAKLTGLSTWKVSTVAAKHGHYFGRVAWLEVANATRAAQLKERKQRLAVQLLDNAELYADALSGVGTPKDGQLVAKALRDIIESSELLSRGTEEESVEEAKDFLIGLRESMRAVRDGFEAQHGVPFGSEEARQIIEGQQQ
ncbi:hypothetical protein [Streptomyces sp. NRRL WC-3626]|uniref:hypothetical protein n=1 Tax=Streptomyces sp. NRRL WC-3626 TaxID=1463926 RepID=UPI00131A8680|nr:hypothetical protein [Streptomyces sp. NRRL WC-3626]